MAEKTLIISLLANKSSKSLEKTKTRTIAQLTQSNSTRSTTTIRHPIGTAMDRYIRSIRAMNKRTAYE
ncbi:MAG TPA: hypothetical protein VE223_05725 [Nitrososphaeraceae archaeon]|nr:hypothetical protein [Nitrososphaeraceae archaeon]